MFKHHKKRSSNGLFVMFRLVLSVVMFVVLLVGIYSAYKHFSGLDPLKLDPVAVFNNIIVARTPKQFLSALPSFKIGSDILGKATITKSPDSPAVPPESSSSPVLFRFLIIADSHTDNADLAKAIDQAKNTYSDLKFIIGLGDYSDVGTISELRKAKNVFDASGLRYFLVPGDHDLWDCRNRKQTPTDCFNEVFGPSYQSFEFDNFEFLLLDNSDDYLGFSDAENVWISSELEKAKQAPLKGVLVFLHEPLFHPSSDRIMGKVEAGLKQQAKSLMFQLKDAGVKQVFAGDIHYFSQYSEPVTGLPMVTVGAVTIERNPQVPRFAVVSILEDSSTKIEDIEIK